MGGTLTLVTHGVVFQYNCLQFGTKIMVVVILCTLLGPEGPGRSVFGVDWNLWTDGTFGYHGLRTRVMVTVCGGCGRVPPVC